MNFYSYQSKIVVSTLFYNPLKLKLSSVQCSLGISDVSLDVDILNVDYRADNMYPIDFQIGLA